MLQFKGKACLDQNINFNWGGIRKFKMWEKALLAPFLPVKTGYELAVSLSVHPSVRAFVHLLCASSELYHLSMLLLSPSPWNAHILLFNYSYLGFFHLLTPSHSIFCTLSFSYSVTFSLIFSLILTHILHSHSTFLYLSLSCAYRRTQAQLMFVYIWILFIHFSCGHPVWT